MSAGTRTGPDNVTSYSSSPELVAVSRFPAFEEEPWLRETLAPIPVVVVAARGPAASIDRVPHAILQSRGVKSRGPVPRDPCLFQSSRVVATSGYLLFDMQMVAVV